MTLAFVDERYVLTVTQLVLPLHAPATTIANPTPIVVVIVVVVAPETSYLCLRV
jgi:hypothetical protein